MFSVVQWDSPWALLLEFLFAVAVFIAIFMVVRRIEKRPSRGPDDGALPLGSDPDELAPPTEDREPSVKRR